MSMLQEFKTFAMKGSVVDLAVGVIVGASFGKIVSALVDKVLMPPIGLMIGGVDFSQLKIVLKAAEGTAPEVAIGYGAFLQTTFDFLIIAWVLFMVIKFMNRLNKQAPAVPPAPSEEVVLLRAIRDSLRK